MHEAHVGDAFFPRVAHADDGNVVAVHGHFQGILVARATVGPGIQHVAEHKGGALFLDGIGQVAQGFANVRAVVLGLVFQHFPDNMQEMRAALCRRDELFYAVAEQDAAHFVVVEDGAEGERGGNFRNLLAFGLALRAKKAAAGNIHQQYHGELAFLLKDLHVRGAHAGRDVPVHVADIVPVLIFAYLAEGHAASLERRMVLTGKNLVAQRFGPNLNLADFLY